MAEFSAPTDRQIRQRALDPQRSFIVQAPAGSGKTGLLVYRILTLLTTVDRPEQILAITFTNKAASEMRYRIMELLGKAEAQVTDTEYDDDYEQQGIALAQQVLKKDKQQGWRLLDMPHQLNILTIDAFCAKLISYMPWLSRLGDKPHTTEKPQVHYQAAIEQLLMELTKDDSAIKSALQAVMLDMDFNYPKIRERFTEMLSKRDQWLRHLLQYDIKQIRPNLEQAWGKVSQQLFQELADSVPKGIVDDLLECARFAAKNLLDSGETKPLISCVNLQSLPEADYKDIDKWQGIRNLILTDSGGLRSARGVDKRLGFPKEEKETKQKLHAVLVELEQEEEFIENLLQLDIIPPAHFSEQQWQQLLALEQVLKQLAGQLQLRFRAVSECDFSEVAQRANLALQDMDNPTDLGLRMDGNLRHILVDEFQDTSHSQLELLKKLVSGWQEKNADNSLFLVGDPMQSIYRFREADVGLFLRIANSETACHVFPQIEIESLQLTENFRSSKPLVNWFNHRFEAGFPKRNNVLQGAISYAHATSSKQASDSPEPICIPVLTKQQEAQQVVEQIRALQQNDKEQKNKQQENKQQKIVILVRGRSHLKDILPALKQANIPYMGVEIQPLNQTQAVLDVLALCKAIAKLDDKVSWLALLHGPWCGLTLVSIKQLLPDANLPVWVQLNNPANQNHLSGEQKDRLQRFIGIMQTALQQRQMVALHDVCKWAWRQLGGEQTLLEVSQQDIDVVFSLIQQQEQAGDLESVAELDKALAGLYAKPQQNNEEAVIISTIHKAKGLQYDTVILPGLARSSGNDAKEVLMWAEDTNQEGESSLLLATLDTERDTASNKNTHYHYLRKLEEQREFYESLRLFYVACTRAKTNLVLLSVMKHNNKGELSKPQKGTLLAAMWAQLEDQFQIQAAETEQEKNTQLDQNLYRLPDGFQYQAKPSIDWQGQKSVSLQDQQGKEMRAADSIEYEWATEVAQAVGIILHEWLQFHSQELKSPELNSFKIGETQKQRWRAEFKAMNIPDERLNLAVKRMCLAIENMQQDEKASWIFHSHQQQQNEVALSTFENGIVKIYRIDRTFVDGNNIRWIIDYKSTFHKDGDIKDFIDQQIAERHKVQLDNYGRLFVQMEDREIRLGVYFPLLKEWREWGFENK